MSDALTPLDPQRPSLTAEVLARLRRAIVSGELAPGSLHSVYEIADRLGVSRTPVREALLLLAAQQMVKFERNRGIRILRTSLHDLEEIFALRLLLEVPATRRATAIGASRIADPLRRHLQQMSRAARAEDEVRFMELDRAFHRVLLEGSGNARLAAYVDTLRDLVLTRGASTAGVSRTLEDIVAEHQLIADAVAAGDPEVAALAMRTHLVTTGRLLIAQEGGDPAAAAFERWEIGEG
jgi:DNA-binding GntR family transcriptional regulator